MHPTTIQSEMQLQVFKVAEVIFKAFGIRRKPDMMHAGRISMGKDHSQPEVPRSSSTYTESRIL
jgi:hypothetical protein